jgi:hypothetical protein
MERTIGRIHTRMLSKKIQKKPFKVIKRILVSISSERGDFSNLLVTAYIPKLYDIFQLTD